MLYHDLKKSKQRMSLRKKEKEDYIEKWEQTILSKSQFCKQEGLKLSTFCSWFPKKQASSFVPVKLISAKPANKINNLLKITFPSGLSIEGIFELANIQSWLKEIQDAIKTI